jgi:[ribosomal protein S5]-alanine N-acetyltransferase
LRETIAINENVYLCPPVDSDIPNFVSALKEREIYERTIMIPYPYTEEDGRGFVELTSKRRDEFGHAMDWGIYKKNEGLIGMIGFYGKSKETPEVDGIGYWLAKPYWNQGIMTMALGKITKLGFEKYGFKRLEMPIFSLNRASCRVAEKCGYHFEKDLPAACQKDGKSIDARLYVVDFGLKEMEQSL